MIICVLGAAQYGFLSRSLFHNSPLSFGETSALDCFQDFLRKTGLFPFCGASWESRIAAPCPKGDGEEGKWGTGGENPEGEGG